MSRDHRIFMLTCNFPMVHNFLYIIFFPFYLMFENHYSKPLLVKIVLFLFTLFQNSDVMLYAPSVNDVNVSVYNFFFHFFSHKKMEFCVLCKFETYGNSR